MAGLGDFTSICTGSVKGCAGMIKESGKGFGALFGNLSGLIRRT